MKIGDGKFGIEKKTYFKLKDGDSVFRIIPALGDLAADGIWSKYYKIHYGYRNTKGNMRVFQSCEVKNNKTKMVEVPDRALERIQKLKAELEKAKEAKNAPMVERLMKLVGGQKAIYNLDSHHYMNALDTQGNIGILKIRHKAKQALDLAIKKLRDAGINPVSVNDGRYFVFSRTGKGLDTTFQVTVAQESLEVPGVGKVNRDIIHKLTDDVINRLEREAAVSIKEKGKKGGLDTLFFAPTAEQVEAIVAQSDILTGKSTAIDAIFDTKETADIANDAGGTDEEESVAQNSTTQAPVAQTGTTTAQGSSSNLVTTPNIATQAAPIATVTAAPAAQAPAPTTIATEAPIATTPQVQQQTAAPSVQASPTPSEKPVVQAPVQAVTSAPSPVQTTAQAVAEITDADFLATLNLN
jgi:hypothetical protein